MKTKKFSQHISGQHEEEVMVVPNLRTDFTLPLSSMAPIVLSGREETCTSHTFSAAGSSKLSGCTSSLKFTFATPIEEKNCPLGSQFGRQTDQGFKFSSPIHVSPGKASGAGAEEGSKSSQEPAVGAATPSAPVWAPQMMTPKVMSPDIGGTSSSFKSYTKWNGNQKSDTSNAYAFGLPVATTLKTGSVMDILGGARSTTNDSSKGLNNNTPLSAIFKKPHGTWECGTCMIQNKADTNKCVACSALKPGSKPNNASAIDGQVKPLSEMFKKPLGSWECDTCMIQNDAAVNKCIACANPKPGFKSQAKGESSSSVPLSELFKTPEGTWECSSCMLQNTSSAAKCVACTTAKSGAKSVPTSSGVPLSQVFKKPEGSWECGTCMIQNTQPAVKCIACGAVKSGSTAVTPPKVDNSLAAMFKKPEGSWECDTCMVQNTSSALRCIACDSSKPGLQTAGIVAKSSSLSSDQPIVINPSGGFSFKQPSTTTTMSGSAGFQFGNSSASVISSNAAPLSTSGFTFENKNSQKSSNSSENNASKTMPLVGGFHFGTPSSSSSSSSSSGSNNKDSSSLGGFQFGASNSSASVVSTSSAASISSGGFQFGAPIVTSTSSMVTVGSGATNISKTPGYQFGAPTTSSSDISAKGGFAYKNTNDSTSVASHSDPMAPGISSSTTSFTHCTSSSKDKTAVMSGFQFGSTAAAPSLVAPSATSTALSQSTFNFGATNATTKSQANSSPFVFGAPASSSTQPNAVGLGMGQSLTITQAPNATPLVNGTFGAGHDAKNPLVSSDFTFGSKQTSTAKRSIDVADHDGPSAKAVPAFGTVPKEPTVNGGFNFNANAGSFAFQSSQPAQSTAVGFQFSANPSAAPATGFAFTNKPSHPPQPAKTGEVSFNATPNFNFSATQSDGSAVFQFGSKAAPEQPSSNMFSFGAASSNTANPQSNASVFGAAPAAAVPNAVGSFNIGAADTSQRKMKKAVRRIKPR